MKTTPILTRIIALSVLVGIGLLASTGCVSSKYKVAKNDTPPPHLLNMPFPPDSLEATLNALVTYNGPGAWKRNAFWDEYVVTCHNPGRATLTVSAATLTDFADASRSPGSKPWALEKESKNLEQKYKEAGVAFVRYTAPGVLIVGAGTAAAFSAGIFSAGATTAAAATVVMLPVYYITVLAINQHNKAAMEKEFDRRRLALPLTLAPGETRTGSFFFPMTPSPRSLGLRWSTGQNAGEAVLPLDFLHGLHEKGASPSATK